MKYSLHALALAASFGAFFASPVWASHPAQHFTETYEAPGVLHTTSSILGGEDTFESVALGDGKSKVDFGHDFSGKYSQTTRVEAADPFGSAGGVGRHVVARSSEGFELQINKDADYFGLWWSAASPGNTLEFYHGGELVQTFTSADLLAGIGNDPAYFGNPSGSFEGQNATEPYAFVNFYDTDGTFNKIVFRQDPATGGGFESDNHTVGKYRTMSGNPGGMIPPVPEPSTWAMLVLGLVGIAATARRRHRSH